MNYSFNLQLGIIQTCCYHADSHICTRSDSTQMEIIWQTRRDSTLQKNKSHAEETLKRQSEEWTFISNSLWTSAEWPLEIWRTSAEDNDSIQSAEKTLGMLQIHNIMSSEPITRSRVRALHLSEQLKGIVHWEKYRDATSTVMSFKKKKICFP